MDDMHQRQELVRNSIEYAASLGNRFLDNLGDLSRKVIYFTGHIPFDLNDLIRLLPPNIEGHNLETNKPKYYANPETAYIVVGNLGFEKVEIERYVSEMQPSVAFLPQEGFIDLLFGKSWWQQPFRWSVDGELLHILDLYRGHHLGLQYVKELSDLYGFPWPMTDAQESVFGGDIGGQWNEESDLKRDYGYSIRDQRNNLLTDSARWNALMSAKAAGAELQYLAGHIADQIQMRKRQRRGAVFYKWSIPRWETDLARLKEEFYDGQGWWPD